MIRVDTSALVKVAGAMRKNAGHAMEGLALKMAEHLAEEAEERTPIDTGLLKNSWKVKEIDPHAALVENPIHYASFVEFGTRFMKGQKFLTTAMAKTEEALPKVTIAHLEKQIRGWFGDA